MNWDKPLSEHDFWNGMTAIKVGEYHGFKVWREFRNEIMKDLQEPESLTLNYEKYLTHCKLMDSPLGRALK